MKKKIIISLILISILTFVAIFLYIDMITSKKYTNKYYSIIYDNIWKIKENKNNIRLINNKSYIDIYIKKISNKYKYYNIEKLPIEEALSNTNKTYKIINKKNGNIGNYNGIELLYEDNKSNSYNIIYKDSNNLYLINYYSPIDNFDILLDSFYKTLYSFEINQNKYYYDYKPNIKYNKITYKNNTQIDNKITNTINYSIHSNHYEVIYSIPNIFKLKEFNSTFNNFEYEDYIINASILNKNIYSYIDKDSNNNIYNEYKLYKDNNYKEQLEYKDNRYIYMNSYKTNNQEYNNAHIIYELDNKHIFEITINSNNNITNKIIENIKLEKSNNYSSYINTININDNFYGNLQKFIDKNNYIKIDLQTNKEYNEIDKNNNMYNQKIFTKEYNEEINDYNEYLIISVEDNIDLDNISNNDIYGFIDNYEYKDLEYDNNININNYKCNIYKGYYSNLSGIDFTDKNRNLYKFYIKQIYCDITNNLYLKITFKSTKDYINNEDIEKNIKFDIIKQEYEK